MFTIIPILEEEVYHCLCFLLFRGSVVAEEGRVKLLHNGSLWISNVASTDAGNYTCRAHNQHGADQVTVALRVQGQ